MNPPAEKRHQSFPLRLSPSLRLQAAEIAHYEGISLNHFISLAIAEKLTRMDPQEQERKAAEQVEARRLSIIPGAKP